MKETKKKCPRCKASGDDLFLGMITGNLCKKCGELIPFSEFNVKKGKK